MRLLIAVCFEVDVSVSDLSESFSAAREIALVWLYFEMNGVGVQSQVLGSLKCSFAAGAAVLSDFQLRLGVSQNVSLQKALKREGLFAKLAREVHGSSSFLCTRFTDPVRNAVMVLDGALTEKAFVAPFLAALEWTNALVSEVDLEMRSQRRSLREFLSAFRALTLLLCVVSLDMSSQRRVQLERLFAARALKILLGTRAVSLQMSF